MGIILSLYVVNSFSKRTIFQVTAGGKLFNVVVDTEDTGKQLLQKGDLRRRVTIIPLNKIQSHLVPSRVQQAAVRLVYGSFYFTVKFNFFFSLFFADFLLIFRWGRVTRNWHFL